MDFSTRLFVLLLVLLRVGGNSDSQNKNVEMKQTDNVESVLTTEQPETDSTSYVQDASEESGKISTTSYPTGEENESKEKYLGDHNTEHETTTPETNTAEPSTPKPTTYPDIIPLWGRIGITATAVAAIFLATFYCIKRKPSQNFENEPVVNFVQQRGLPLLRRNVNNGQSPESDSGDVPSVPQ